MSNLALTYGNLGRTKDAAGLQEMASETRQRNLGDEHPATLMNMNNLASTYCSQGRMVEAAALQEKVLVKRWEILGDDHPSTITIRTTSR